MNLYYSSETGNFTTNISDKRDPNAVANAIYNKTYEKIGWDYLSISSYEKNDNKYNDSLKAYGMGYLEGILTKDRIYSQYNNFFNFFLSDYQQNPQVLEVFYNFMLTNIEYMKNNSLKNLDKDPYWEYIYYIYQQIKGLYDGYIKVAEKEKHLEFKQMIILAYISESEDIANYLFRNMRPNFEEMTEKEKERYSILNSHCSAFIKLANDFSDIWFGHNTWNFYVLMTRIFKEYRFVTIKGNEKSKSLAFSSYPGALSSLDEFYYMDSNLLVMGTSLNILNNSLYDLITTESIFIWVRQMVANKLASNSEEWTEIYKRDNSGTNNGQYMILDMNKIDSKNKKIDNKALMIIELMPKYTESLDVTDHLRKGYWPSYNVPYLDKIYKGLGYEVDKNEKGEDENIKYTQSPRAKIFKRDQGKINSQEAFKTFMRYNNYKNDNFSENDPSNTIAARGDLADEDKSCHGAIDVKFVSIKELLEKNNIIHIISGPSNEQQPTFSWKNTTCETNPQKKSYLGQNEVWNFPQVDYKVQLFEKSDKKDDKDKNPSDTPKDGDQKKDNKDGDKSYIYWIIGSSIFVVIVAVIIVVVLCNKKKYKNVGKDINKISFTEDGIEGGQEQEQEENLIT